MAVTYQQSQRFRRPDKSLQAVGVQASVIDPVDTLESKVYRIPVQLTRGLTEFEERALEQASPFEFELAGSMLYIESSLETLLDDGGAEKIAEALDYAVRVGEELRTAALAERQRLDDLGEGIEHKFRQVFGARR